MQESPILKTSCVSSGDKPRRINIGTKIGAIIAHLAESTGIKIFINVVRIMKLIVRGRPTNPIDSKILAPVTEIIIPMLE